MTNFHLTEELIELIKTKEADVEKREALLKSDSIGHEELISFHSRCKPKASLLELIQTTRLKLPKREEKSAPKTKDFEELMRILRLQEQEDQYQRLVSHKPAMNTLYETKFNEEQDSAAKMHKEIKSHITTIFNIFISVASVVYAIWYWTSSSWGLRDGYRVLLCLFFGILILVAEVVVYMGYLNKVEEAKRKERSKTEVKKVIRTFTMT